MAFFKQYLEDLERIGEIEPDLDMFGLTGGSYGGLGYGSNDSPEFGDIYSAVRATTNASFANKMREIASAYLERIGNDPEEFSSLYEFGVEKGDCAGAPFLHFIDPKDFAHLMVMDSSPNDRLLASLHRRYELDSSGQTHALVEEYDWLK